MIAISTQRRLSAVSFWVVLVSSLVACPCATKANDSEATKEAVDLKPVSYHRDVLPIFRTNCLGCHQGAKQRGEYVMTQFDRLLQGGETGEKAIVPGNPDESYLIAQITPVDGHAEMPDEPAKPLSPAEIELIRRWVAEGAEDDSPAKESFDAEHPSVYHNSPTITSLDVSSDGKLIAAAGLNEVFLIDAATGQRLHRLIGNSPRINSVRFSPDSTRLAVAGGTPAVEGEIQVWDLQTFALELSKSVTYDTLSGVRWSPDGSQLSFGAGDNSVRAIDPKTGEQVLFQGAHEDWVLDTVYTVDGKNLVSVARDMSCKLTDVATERFIDNITSITPGALSGGLNSVERHPTRDEIMLGGADGVAKVYRVFRQTARKIGDDANLIRQMPAMPGRIFSVAISRDGTRLAAASTLNGQSEVRVWNYDFNGTMSDEITRISGKRVNEISTEEKKKLDDYKNSPVSQVWRAELGETAVYSIRFAPDQSLFVAGDDGIIRRYAADGQQGQSIEPIDPATIVRDAKSALAFDPISWNRRQTSANQESFTEVVPDVGQVTKLELSPGDVQLDSPVAYSQLLVSGTLQNGSTVDLTRAVQWKLPSFVIVTANGAVRPLSDGKGELTAAFGALSATVTISVDGVERKESATGFDVDFIRDVNPVLSRLGCNQGTCHGAQAGKNGFKLSLRGYDPIFDIRALTDDHAARRISAADPDQSLMLQKPLGRAPHQGGTLMNTDDPSFAILRSWIADGCRLRLDTPRVKHIELTPHNPVVNEPGSRQQVRVVAHYEDGKSRDVTAEAFVTSGNTDVAEANTNGLLTAIRRGEAPILARYEGSYAATTMTVMGKREDFHWTEPPVWNSIDAFVVDKWQRMKIVPSDLCTDEEFIRRVYLDLTGLPPASEVTRAFVADKGDTQRKRAAVVDGLIASKEFVEFWTNKWADLLQVNRKFLGVEGSAAYRSWIRDSVARNQPYDEFARDILTAMGSNKAHPQASYFKVLRTPEETMENTTHLFLGIRFNCNKCHDHPFERWTQDQYYETAAFFKRTSLRADPASGKATIGGSAVDGATPLYEEVYEADAGEMNHPRTSKEVTPGFPYPAEHEEKTDGTRRDKLAAWMTSADNQYFARSYVNRVWGYLTGVGLIEPIDDIRAGNPPTNPELLDYLTASFVQSKFDRLELVRMICNSRTYQLSGKSNPWNEDDTQNYSHATPRRLSAEVLFDTVHFATGSVPNIPGIPRGTRAAELPDAGARTDDGFLQNLGRPVRESACECERSSDLQLGPVMALVSGPTVGQAIADSGNDINRLVNSIADDQTLVEEIFLRTLSRKPGPEEIRAFEELRKEIGSDHLTLANSLKEREAWWAEEVSKREAARLKAIKKAEEQLASAIEAAKPEQDRLAKERDDKVSAAKSKLAEVQTKTVERQAAWEKQQTDKTEWFPLVPSLASSTNKDSLRVLEDRSIVVTGNADKGIYSLTFNTNLQSITGIRIEALPMDLAAGKGPGLSDNANFVLTELEIAISDRKTPKEQTPVPLTGGLADFSQDSFSPEAAIDGQSRDQGGWAISGSTLHAHWMVFQTKEPLKIGSDKNLVVKLHQFHNAAKHRLGRFRISFTTSTAKTIPLGLAEPYRAALSQSANARSESDKKLLTDYFESIDPAIKKEREALAAASAPVPSDPNVVDAKARVERAKQPVLVDAQLERLRTDAGQSELQIKNERLTAAEDLVWALINSPEFLFNR